MAFPQKKAVILPLSEERRRFQRVRVNLLGRYMLADRREFPCQVTNMSPGGMALIAPVPASRASASSPMSTMSGGSKAVIARQFENGFAMTISATTRKRDKLAAQLTWLANRHILGLPEDRRHGRITPRNPAGRLILPNGVNVACRVIDISQSGAAISTDQRPEIGSPITIGKTTGTGGAPPRGRHRDRVHPPAAPGLSRRQRHRRVNAPAQRASLPAAQARNSALPSTPPFTARSR